MNTMSLRTRQFLDMTRIFMADFRSTWHFNLIFSLMLPLGMLGFLKFTGAGGGKPEMMVYFVSGNVIMSLAFGVGQLLINRIGWARQERHFDYWSSLPISKLALVLAIVLVNVLLALPGIVVQLVIGIRMLHAPVTTSWLLVPTLMLTVLSVAGLAAMMGTLAKDGTTANLIANLFGMIVTFVSPVFVPAEQLGTWAQVLSYVLPTSYGARAIREALQGQAAAAGVDLACLAVFTVITLVVVQRKLDWRGER